MTWMLWLGLGLLVLAVLGLVAVGALMLATEMRERRAPKAPDDAMAVADGLGFQRSTWWTGQDRARRLSEGWIAHAEEQMDWHAYEHEMKRRVR